jgi:glycine/D-amino acid oxidase-like deaminating enzyme
VDTPFWLDESTSPVEADSQDLLPLVGRVPSRDGTWIAAGYSGHGNRSDLVASALQGREDPLLELFAPARFLVSG